MKEPGAVRHRVYVFWRFRVLPFLYQTICEPVIIIKGIGMFFLCLVSAPGRWLYAAKK